MPNPSNPASKNNQNPVIIPGAEPFFFKGGSTGCLLLHGFSASPEEMRPLGEFLASRGFTVYGIRLAGHGTHPNDLKRIRWKDWLHDVEDGLDLISATSMQKVLIGQSMGGVIALTAAARFSVSGVVVLSTPYGVTLRERLLDQLARLLRPMIDKDSTRYNDDHPLYHRRELNYPAYPEIPARSLAELDHLALAMQRVLPQVRVPVLILQSRADTAVPFTNMQQIYEHLGSPRKEMHPLEGMDHSLVQDPQREVVFTVVEQFLNSLQQ